MPKRALLVGINDYDNFHPPLDGCVADAQAMAALLERHDNGDINYECEVLTSDVARIGRKELRRHLMSLFEKSFDDDALFYFSGHGTPTHIGGALVTQEGERDDPGVFMTELLTIANNSQARSIILILDCCYAGLLGDIPPRWEGNVANLAQLREGVTILVASNASQKAMEVGGQGVFTKLVLGALRGGAADVRGRVSAASIYAYVDQTLGAWKQRPMYKSHADHLPPVRLCSPAVEDATLRELPNLFPDPHYAYRMDPSYERTRRKVAKPEKVAIFDTFKTLRNARLLTTENGMDLYYVAIKSKTVTLTPSGQFYWHLAATGRI